MQLVDRKVKLLVGLVENGHVIERRNDSADHTSSVHDTRRVYQEPALTPKAITDVHGDAQNRLLVAHRNSPGKFRGWRAPVHRQPWELACVDFQEGIQELHKYF